MQKKVVFLCLLALCDYVSLRHFLAQDVKQHEVFGNAALYLAGTQVAEALPVKAHALGDIHPGSSLLAPEACTNSGDRQQSQAELGKQAT